MAYLRPWRPALLNRGLSANCAVLHQQAIHTAQFAIKCWPQHTYSDISPHHEQKHLLHNRSNRRYRNRAQIARPILEVGLAVAIATSEESSLLMRIATLSVSLSLPAKGRHLEVEVS